MFHNRLLLEEKLSAKPTDEVFCWLKFAKHLNVSVYLPPHPPFCVAK